MLPAAVRFALAAGIAVVACAASDSAAAADPGVSLPEVTVTAPPVTTPSYKKWTPYLGNPRVEEDKWPEIPCDGSRIAAPGAGTCKKGPWQMVAPMGLPVSNVSPQTSNCRIAHDLVMNEFGPLTVETDIMVFDPTYISAIGFQHRACAVRTDYYDPREDFPDMNQMARQGSGWRSLQQNGDLTVMEFSIGARDCRAVEKRGPKWGDGRVYVVHASFCRKDGRPIEPTDVDAVLGSLSIRQYDPTGNLRAPP